MIKGYWTCIVDDSKAGFHYHCFRCHENKPFIKGQILSCSCDKEEGELPIPAGIKPIKAPPCKKISTGTCLECGTPCCKEGK